MLREKQGLTLISMAEKMGLTSSWYWDLEAYHDEVTDTLSLNEVEKLSKILKVSMRYLLADDEEQINSAKYVSPQDLSDQIKIHLKENQMRLEELEDEIGWELEWFLKDPSELLDCPAMFLMAVCKPLNIQWLEVVPE